MRAQVVVLVALFLLVSVDAQQMNIWRRIQAYGCTNEKIEVKDKIGQCKCQDGSQCIWSEDKTIMGCPCKVPVKPNQQPVCLKQAASFGCSPNKFECKSNFGQCTCPDNSTCAWANDKSIMGCPCGQAAKGAEIPQAKPTRQVPTKHIDL